jgi:predicted phage terminase large subunit-like protein
MATEVWKTEYLYAEANKFATAAAVPLDVKHFWKVADRDLAGQAPKSFEEAVVRAKNYIALDLAIAKAPDQSNPDVAASVRRVEILKNCPSSLQTMEFLRFMCRTNLLFLGRDIFNKDWTFFTHAPVCNFFIQKDPTKELHDQDVVKDRLLMYPRGGFKSTIDIVDCVQIFINFPDARVLVLTAAVDLATDFIGELKNYFFVAKDAELTNFQKLFPEWSLEASTMGPEDKFFCPKRTQGDLKKKDPSSWASSILSTLPGKHCDWMKADDVVNDKNSETPQLVRKVINKVNFAESLVDPGGYKDLIGTPYAGNDLYAFTAESAEKPEDLIRLVTPARWLIPSSQHKDERDCSDADYELLFEFDKNGRARLTHDFLNKKRRKSPEIYTSQYMLNAAGVRKVKFAMDLLIQRTIPLDQLPHQLRYYILWDFAYAANTSSDYSVGAVIGLDMENRAYLVELLRDHYIDSDLAQAVVSSFQKYQPRLVCIENSNGAQFLESAIRRYASEAGISYIPLDFFKVDRSPNAKASRVSALQPRLLRGELFFLNSVDYLEELHKEFKDFGTSLHDDIPDAISHYQRILPVGTTEPGGPGGKQRQEQFNRALQEKDFYDMLFQQGDYAPVVPEAPIVPEPGTGDTSDEDLYDPYGIQPFKR